MDNMITDMEALTITLRHFGEYELGRKVDEWRKATLGMQGCLRNQTDSIAGYQQEDLYKSRALNDMQDTITSLERMLAVVAPVEFSREDDQPWL